MHVIKRISLLLLFLISLYRSQAQVDSCSLTISLLTCSPGEDLYSLFGHSALRVKDATRGIDIIYNYGTFDFEDPDFYIKFTRGTLLYSLSMESPADFLRAYQMENRTVTEQILRLTCARKQQIFAFLQENALEQNRYYHYKFLSDNCTTRLRDILERNADDSLSFGNIVPVPPPTFRNMLHEYLDRGKQYWSKLGIDLLLGSNIDVPVNNREAMFLPDYLMKGFDSAMLDHSPLVLEKRILINGAPQAEKASEQGITPGIATILLLLIVTGLSLIKYKWAERSIYIFDVFFFFILGALGVFMLIMWFGTNHEPCADNYNLLWALPTHLPAALFLLWKKDWIRHYFAASAFICLAVLIAWRFLPQELNTACIPVVLLAGIRSAHRSIKK